MRVLIAYSDPNCSCTRKNTFELSKGLSKIIKKCEVVLYKNLSESHFNDFDIILFQRLGANGAEISKEYLNRITDLINKYRKKVLTVYNIDDLILNYVTKYFISLVNLVLVPNLGYDRYIYPLNENIAYTRTFIDKDLFENIKSSLNLPKNKLKFLWTSTGLLGFDFILKLIPEINKNFPDSLIYTIGGGNQFKEYKNVIHNNIVSYEKFIEYFKECDIYLNPISSGISRDMRLVTNTDDFINCKSEIKYLHCGLSQIPIISSRSLPYEYAIKNKINGLLVDNKTEDWLEAINLLEKDKDLKKYITENAYKDVINNYLLENLGRRIYKIFKKTLDIYSKNSFELPNIDLNQTGGISVVGELFGGKKITQEFISNYDNLSILEIKVATYMRVNTGKLKIEIYEKLDQEKALRTFEIESNKLNDNSWITFKFDPIKSSKGKKYYLLISSTGSKLGSSVTMYYDPLSNDLGDFFINKTKFKGSLNLKTYYYAK